MTESTRLTLKRLDGPRPYTSQFAERDAEGRLVFRMVPPGRYAVSGGDGRRTVKAEFVAPLSGPIHLE
jgi:hypothetical protein